MSRAPRLVTVVVPVRDAAATVGEQLDALAAQDHAGAWELVVADSGSRDGTRAVVRERLGAFPAARLVDATGSTPNGASRARNRGAAAARGDFLAFCDADDVADPGWLRGLAAAAAHADLVAGRLDDQRLNPPSVRAWHEPGEWEREPPLARFLAHASTANCGVWREAFDALGGYREHARGAEDRDFAYRAQLSGLRLRAAPDAVIAYRHRSTPLATARQHFEWGAANARLYRDFGHAGLPRARPRELLAGWAWSLGALPTLPWSRRRRGLWARRTALQVGQLAGSARWAVVFP